MATIKKKDMEAALSLKLTREDVVTVMSRATTQTKAHQVVRALCAEWLKEHEAEWVNSDLSLQTDTSEIGRISFSEGAYWAAYYKGERFKARLTHTTAKKLIEKRAREDGYKIVRKKK